MFISHSGTFPHHDVDTCLRKPEMQRKACCQQAQGWREHGLEQQRGGCRAIPPSSRGPFARGRVMDAVDAKEPRSILVIPWPAAAC